MNLPATPCSKSTERTPAGAPLPAAAAKSACDAGRCASAIDRGSQTAKSSPQPEAIRRKVDEHPCYSQDAHHYFARMHAAVAPACNIQCNYCNRKYDCSNESRPGVTTQLLTPDQAIRKTLAVAAAIPQLSVLGIAGPGDPLANPERTFATLRGIAQHAPDLKLCLSTNGLALPELVDEIARHNIEHVTITINCVDAAIGARIYPWIFWRNRRVRGRAAAKILIEQQQRGLELLVARGILVKVNSVLIPGVNDAHLIEVSRIVKAKGAFLHNIMPLIAAPEHGTYFGLTGQRAPSDDELERVRDACEGGATLMRHCRQCRADAVGLLGEDRGAEFTQDKVDAMVIDHEAALARRLALRARIADELAQKSAAKLTDKLADGGAARPVAPQVIVLHRSSPQHVLPVKTAAAVQRALRVAVASSGGGLINQHFGHAREFLIYDVDAAGVRLVGVRKVDLYCHGSAQCGDEDGQGDGEGEGASLLERTLAALAGCERVLCARIGIEPWGRLEAAGITPDGAHAYEAIDDALPAVWNALRAAGKLAAPAGERRA